MDPWTKRALEAIDRVCETPTPTGPVQLEPEYLRMLEQVEALSQNQSGVDKSWVEESHVRWIEHYRSARLK